MKITSLKPVQKLLLGLLLFLASINLYYVIDFNTANLLNPSSILKKEKAWISFDNYELQEERTQTSLFYRNSTFGITHKLILNVKHNSPLKQRELSLTTSQSSYSKSTLSFIDTNRAILTIESSFLSNKEIHFIDNEGRQLLVKTNPFTIVNNDLFEILGLIICLLIACTFSFSCISGATLFAFTLYAILFLTTNYLYTILILVLTQVSLFRIKMVYIANAVDFTFNKIKPIMGGVFTLSLLICLIVEPQFNFSSIAFSIFISGVSAFVAILITYFSYNVYKVISIALLFSKQEVFQISATNLKDGINKKRNVRQMPFYTGDIILNLNHKLTMVDLDPIIYKKLIKNKSVLPIMYKTDGKNNYIFFN
ncbi:MAG: hypothetical protein LBI72_10395 [Flavobacteriaceae bacterium]|jgi:hypothetical protein|nr:hypothetical protein [Flavobacteriaceae bacterium]